MDDGFPSTAHCKGMCVCGAVDGALLQISGAQPMCVIACRACPNEIYFERIFSALCHLDYYHNTSRTKKGDLNLKR